MKVSLLEVMSIIEQLISGRLSREEAAEWAQERQKAEDNGDLEFESTSEEEIIWDAILYLEGVDMKIAPDSYLHSLDDFVEYQRTHLAKYDQ